MIKDNIWLIGTGLMAQEYAKVLNALGIDYQVIGRGEYNSKTFFEAAGVQPFIGGLELFLESCPKIPLAVINATGIESLTETTRSLLRYGVYYMLVEKPGFAYHEELESTTDLINQKRANVLLAYNRRFYASVMKAQEIIKEDGGVSSFFFEFTEWSHIISKLNKNKAEHENWFYGNSSHVIDIAFYLGGIPIEISTYKSGSLSWHPSGSKFAGSGKTENDALFAYIANWEAPGRWSVEILTSKHRLILRPLETLKIQKIGSVAIEPVEIDDSLDLTFKPGLFLQTQAFLEKNLVNFCSIIEQDKRNINLFKTINGNSH